MYKPFTEITEEELSRLRAEGWILAPPTGFTPGYRPYWEMWHAIREFVQNSLDEAESFRMRITPEGLEISDEGTGIFIRNLLLSKGEKPPWKRGLFGEGLKIACLVCLRAGYPVDIYTIGTLIRPFLLYMKVWEPREAQFIEAKTLHFIYRSYPKDKGTTVLIRGYTGSLYRERFFQNIPLNLIAAQKARVINDHIVYDSVIDNVKPPEYKATLFVRDIYVMELWKPALYSYNLWRVELDPDRVGVRKPWQVSSEIRTIWETNATKEMVRKLFKVTIEEKITNTMELETGLTWIVPEKHSIWQEVWKEFFGDAVLWTNSDDAREAEHLRFKVVDVPEDLRKMLVRVITKDADVVEEHRAKLRVPLPSEELTKAQKKQLALAYWLLDEILAMYAKERTPRKEPKLVIYKDLPNPGEYSDNEIRFRQDVLYNEGETVRVLIHELAHHTSFGAKDLTDEHVNEMTYIAWLVWRLEKRPTNVDLYNALKKHGITPPIKPPSTKWSVPTLSYPAQTSHPSRVIGRWGTSTGPFKEREEKPTPQNL